MSEISNPNWLAIAGYLHLSIALGLTLKSQLRHGPAGDAAARAREAAQRHVDALMAVPFLIVGIGAIVGGQLATSPITPSIVLLILSVPLALLLYLGYEGLWIEALAGEEIVQTRPQGPMLSLPRPQPERLHSDPAPHAAPASEPDLVAGASAIS